LFDGQTLFGWQAASQGRLASRGWNDCGQFGREGAAAYTTAQFGDYVLRLDFRSEAGANSGIFLHTPPVPEDPAKDCYELNIADADNPFPTGSLVYRAKAEGDFDSHQWQSYEVTVRAIRSVKLDGQHISSTPIRNRFGGGISGCSTIRAGGFPEHPLKPLGLQSLFNGRI
jgi:hypothetical protein